MAEPATDESCRRCGFDKQSHDRWLPGTCECFQKELEIPTDKEVNEYRRIAESHSEKRGKMDSIVLRLLARLDAEITARQAAERRVEELRKALRHAEAVMRVKAMELKRQQIGSLNLEQCIAEIHEVYGKD